MKESFLTFDQPYFLLLLFFIPLISFLKQKQSSISLYFSSVRLFSQTKSTLKLKSKYLTSWLQILGLCLLIIALARPQYGIKFAEATSDGIDIILALDTSGSMKALDFKMQGDETNRLDVVKDVVSKFIEKRPFDRIGLVVFGDESFTQCPLTTDQQILKTLVSRLTIGMAGDGTAIGDGLALALKRMNDQKAKSKIVILLTDGRNNAGSLTPEIAAELAKDLSIKVYTIGVGSAGLVPYPEATPFGTRKIYAQLDLDESTLKLIAEKSGGKYFRATDTEHLEDIYHEIDSMEKSQVTVTEHKEVNELFINFILAGFILLLTNYILKEYYWFSIP